MPKKVYDKKKPVVKPKDYSKIRNSHPQRLFGLIQESEYGQKLVAEVKAPTKSEAIGLFQKKRKWSMLLSDKIQRFTANQVVELGGMDLLYVQTMKPGEVRVHK